MQEEINCDRCKGRMKSIYKHYNSVNDLVSEDFLCTTCGHYEIIRHGESID